VQKCQEAVTFFFVRITPQVV